MPVAHLIGRVTGRQGMLEEEEATAAVARRRGLEEVELTAISF